MIPTKSVIFDVSTDRGIKAGNQTLTEIMYRVFLDRMGYARDLDLSELEITLEGEGRLDEFKAKYAELFSKDWDEKKNLVAFSIAEASRVMHELAPDNFPVADTWLRAAQNRSDITPKELAKRCKMLMDRRYRGQNIVFVIDEVGQFVARDVQKMLDLQSVVEQLGVQGRGRMWIAVTSQESLQDIVSGFDDRRVELSKIKVRFSLQVHLEPSDISEVTSKRILLKNSAAEQTLGELFKANRGRLTDNTRLTADIQLPEINTQSFVDLYPLLPYQIDLIIQVVSGLRTQGGAVRHVGGANRTIIKLAQQLLIHPDVDLGGKRVGALARLDQIYDLVAGNISSDIRGKIADIKKEVSHPLAQPVSKAVCLLQFVKSVHRTAENIAASLHESVDGDSLLPQVREALEALKAAHKVREGDDGFRIPTPAEDDWERQRIALSAPKPGETNRIHQEVVHGFWQPKPSHNFMDTKVFKAGLTINGRNIEDGDIMVHMGLGQQGEDYDDLVEEMRKRSQMETQSVFWAVSIDDAIDRQTVEIFRSREMVSKKGRGAKTRDETALVAEEKGRLRRHEDELKRFLKQACLSGTIYFRGNDRSPDEAADSIKKVAEKSLLQALPEVFSRFQEAAVRVQKKDLDTLLTTENLHGLTPLFSSLGLLKDQSGNPVLDTESVPLAEVLSKIENRTSYGETASGKYLESEFSKEPFGWDFDMVRLFAVCLVRAGAVEATSKGQAIEYPFSIEAKNTFTNNNLFRQAAFRPKEGLDFEKIVDAAEHYKEVFGSEVAELEQTVVAKTIREAIRKREKEVQETHSLLLANSLPGSDMPGSALGLMRAIREGNEERTILDFNGSYKEIREAIARASELAAALTEPRLKDFGKARKAMNTMWPFLQKERDVDESFQEKADELADLMQKATFFKNFPEIDQHAKAIEKEYQTRFDQAAKECADGYSKAMESLKGTPGWEQLDEDQRNVVAEPIAAFISSEPSPGVGIPKLRSDTDACKGRLDKAIESMMRIIDGNRVVSVQASSFFKGGIETEEQLDSALQGLKEECERHIGAGKKILIQ
ncbi:BREX system P-loop protein BrxC [Thermodesulfobacteriota bacterium]